VTKQSFHAVWLVGIVLLVGCARPETVEVSGTVTWEGAPIANGDIIFASIDPHIPAAAGKISEGAFMFRCKPGKKRVEISSFRLSGKKTPQGRPIGEMYIPNRYSSESELLTDVTPDGENKFDFALKP
jgi:hypothetical protein